MTDTSETPSNEESDPSSSQTETGSDESTLLIPPSVSAPISLEQDTLHIIPANVEVTTLPAYEQVQYPIATEQAQYTPQPVATGFGASGEQAQYAPQPAPFANQFPYPQQTYPPSSAQLQPGWTGVLAQQQPPKRSRKGWLILVIVLVVLLVGGGTALAISVTRGPDNTPAQVLQKVCDAYQTFNGQELYDTYDKAGQSAYSVSQLQESFDTLKSLGSLLKISNCLVSNVQESNNTATGTITLTETMSLLGISSSMSQPITMGLLVENNLWKVDPSKTKTSPVTVPTMTLPTFPPDYLTPAGSGNFQ